MSYPDSATRARIEAQLAKKRELLAIAEQAYTSALGTSEIKSYRFDSGEGNQFVDRRKPAEIRAEIFQLENEIERLQRKLRGGGIVNMNLRRR